MKNKRGWMRIIEAFIAVLLIGAVLIIVINQQNNQQSNTNSAIYNYEISILRAVELNDTLRTEIVGINNNLLPLNWSSSNFPSDIKNKIMNITSSSFICQAQICLPNDGCPLVVKLDKDIYAQSVTIFALGLVYSPKQLKIFCFTKQ